MVNMATVLRLIYVNELENCEKRCNKMSCICVDGNQCTAFENPYSDFEPTSAKYCEPYLTR